MKKLLMLLIVMTVMPVFAYDFDDVNPNVQSYGVWVDVNGGDDVSISKDGIDKFVDAPAECVKEGEYTHETDSTTGREIIASLNKAMLTTNNKAYKARLQSAKATIDKNKNYFTINAFLSCSNEYDSFIQITNHKALYVVTPHVTARPYDVFYFLEK